MALLEFKETYRSGIDPIDYEHEILIDLINELHTTLANDHDKTHVEDILGELHGKISAHFALEEATMREMKYAEYKPHMEEHNKLLDEILEIGQRFAKDPTYDYMHDLEAEIRHWFMHHFVQMDSRLHNMMKEKGLT